MIGKHCFRTVAALLISVLPLLLAGCHIETHKDGKDNNVNIGTPFGSMSVKTDEPTTLAKVGLTPYPGATFVKKQDGNDGAADVNMSFGNFKLGVRAAELRTADGQDKVLAFYRKDMHRYGLVLTCRGKETVGEPARTADGLTCGTDRNGGSDDDEVELRAGSQMHQHIVGLHTDGGGTRIGLVALDLPFDLKNHHSDDQE